MRASLLLALLLAAGAALAGDARAQDGPAYPHPLFTGPIYTAPEAPYDAEHARLSLIAEPDAPVLGDVRYRLRLLRDGVTRLPFLAADLPVDSAWVGVDTLEATRVERSGDTLFVVLPGPDAPPGPDTAEDTTATVALTDSLAGDTLAADTLAADAPAPRFRAGDVLEVRLTFAADAGFARGEGAARLWTPALGRPEARFPVPVAPADRLTADLVVTLPADWSLAAPGAVVRDEAEARRTVHLRLDRPVRPADLVFAAGPGEVAEERLDGAGAPLLVGPADRSTARSAGALRYLAAFLRTPYPWPAARFALVPESPTFPHAVAAGGGAFLLAERALADEESRDSLFAAALSRAWLGGLVVPTDPREAWWVDAAAAYLAARYAAETVADEAVRPADALDLHLQTLAGRYLDEAARYRRPLVWDVFTHPAELRDAHAAAKGAWVLHMLRSIVGEDAFRTALADVLAGGGPVDTEALEAAFSGAAGRDVGRFFDAWVYGAGHPVLEVETTYLADEEALRLDVRQVQDGYLVPGVFDLPLTVEVHTLFGEHRFDLRMTEREETFTLDVPMEPRFVLVDPDDVLLADVRLRQDAAAWVAQARYAASPTARVRAARALAAFRDEPALLVGLTNALGGEAVPAVRAALVRTLAALPVTPSLERALLAASADPDGEVRAAAVRALGRHAGSAEAAARALDAARNDTDLRVVAAAVEALGALGAPEAGDVVRAALVTPSPRDRVRAAAFRALPGTDLPPGEQRALALEHAVPAASPEVYAAALHYLAAHAADDDATLARLRTALDDPRRDVRGAALAGLAALGTDAARALLEGHLAEEPDPLLRALHAPFEGS